MDEEDRLLTDEEKFMLNNFLIMAEIKKRQIKKIDNGLELMKNKRDLLRAAREKLRLEINYAGESPWKFVDEGEGE